MKNTIASRSAALLICLYSGIIAGANTSFAIITSDAVGTHVAAPGQKYFDINHDGVVRLTRNGNPSCTANLLEGGRHVLTAAHCLRFDPKDTTMGIIAHLPTGLVAIEAESWHQHPKYKRESGYDVGILVLKERAPTEIPRYRLFRDLGNDVGAPNYIFGFGQKGHGTTGRVGSDGLKRYGRNRYEGTGATNRPVDLTLGGDDRHRILFSDFDSGLPENDAFGVYFGASDLGYGADEVSAINGDSGAGIFIKSPSGEPLIAGTVSSGAPHKNLPPGVSSDVDEEVNGTWGEISVDTRIAAPETLAFLDSFTSQALESTKASVAIQAETVSVKFPSGLERYVYVNYSTDLTNWKPLSSVKVPPNTTHEIGVMDLLNETTLPDAMFFQVYTERP